ncbi:NAD-dependent epimerase/dehydratase family protein [Parafrigoribacterium mesophilum]|uniref:NAD-dependent epimerase/dehydratase family protein n=1 Tax=Parafrigoribacterium mesophilum TaxID=433646 RepID=UPI0031FCC3A5
MRAVVTGVAGFIGSTLARTLLEDTNNEVIGIDAFTDYYDVGLKQHNVQEIPSDRFTLVTGDINELPLSKVLRGSDVIFHLAGQPGVRRSWGTEFDHYTRHNINATQRLLEVAREIATLRAFVFASSSSVYGNAVRYPTSELDRPAPLSPYGVTKLAAEHLCSLYAANFAVPTVSLRYFTVYGPRQRPDMAFNKFISAALDARELRIYGDGTQIREFTHVSDIVRANLLASQAGLEPGAVINLSGGAAVSINEVIDIVAALHGSRPAVAYGKSLPGDVLRTGGDTSRARELLDWRPLISIEEGLETEYAWLCGVRNQRLASAS